MCIEVLVGNLKGRDHLEPQELNGRIIKNALSGSELAGMDGIDLAQNRERCLEVVSD